MVDIYPRLRFTFWCDLARVINLICIFVLYYTILRLYKSLCPPSLYGCYATASRYT